LRFRKQSPGHDIVLDKDQLSKKIFELANSLELKKIYIHSEKPLILVDEIITTLNEWERKINVTRPVIKEDATLMGLIDIAASIAHENQTVIFQ